MAERSVLIWLAIGLVAGLVARMAGGRRDSGGPAVTILIGIAGALLAGFAGQALNLVTDEMHGALVAAAGAILLLVLYRLMIARRA